MRFIDLSLFLLPFLAITQVLAEPRFPSPKPMPRALDAVLVEPPSSRSTSSLSPTPTPFLQHLDLRQVAAAQPAAAAPVAAAPAAAAPAAGVGGAGAAPAAAQPAAGAQANPVTTIMVATVVGGVTTQVPKVYTQTFGAAVSAPPVQSGEIGLGTLTGKIGVVKTSEAKNDAVPVGGRIPAGEMMVVLVAGLAAVVGGGAFGMARL